MRVHLCVVGRLRAGAEHSLINDYLDRFDKTGRGLGLRLGELVEVDDRKGGGMTTEATAIRKALPAGSVFWVMDERGATLSSPGFATRLAKKRDAGQGDLSIIIGGADGIAPDLRAEADLAISFGAMVWPHMLARVMLSEQLYRAATILGGSPYHRV